MGCGRWNRKRVSSSGWPRRSPRTGSIMPSTCCWPTCCPGWRTAPRRTHSSARPSTCCRSGYP
ncbi:hypothetical protein CIW51_26535 [Mycolicibacterium sp. P9-22]|nr:hypothetical protein CIW51_26535 [Mycolicibacterium sp. P9-22]